MRREVAEAIIGDRGDHGGVEKADDRIVAVGVTSTGRAGESVAGFTQ